MTGDFDDALRGPDPEAPGPVWAIPLLAIGALAAFALAWWVRG